MLKILSECDCKSATFHKYHGINKNNYYLYLKKWNFGSTIETKMYLIRCLI